MCSDSVKHKVVAMVRKYSKQIDDCPDRLNAIRIAQGNLTTALEAAEKHDCKELATAVMAQEAIRSTSLRNTLFTYLEDPITCLQSLESEVENFKDYL